MVEHMATSVMILNFVPGETVTLPITGISGEGIQVDFGSGFVPFTSQQTITGITTGRVDISGNFTTFGLGSQPWSNSSALIDVSGALPSSVTSLAGAFHGAINFTGSDLMGWDVSNVTDMSYMFAGTFQLGSATLNLGGWDTGAVQDMSYMFCGSTYFQDVSGMGVDMWDVTEVTDMSYMFEGTEIFNNTGLGRWDTYAIKNTASMFSKTTAYSGAGIERWNVAGVTDMTNMFNQAVAFSNLDISLWDTSVVTSMAGMFYKATGMYNTNLLADLSGWTVGSVGNHNLFLSKTGTEDTSASDSKSPFYLEGSVAKRPFSMQAATAPTLTTDWTNTVTYPIGTQIDVILIGQGGGGTGSAGGNAAGIQFKYTFEGPVNNIILHKGTTGAAGTNGDNSSITFTDLSNIIVITAGGGLSDGSGGKITFSVTVGGNTNVITVENGGELTGNSAFNFLAYGVGTNGDAQSIMNGYQAGGGQVQSLFDAGKGATDEAGTSGETRLNLAFPITLPVSGIAASGIMVDVQTAQTTFATEDPVTVFTSGPINIFGNFSKFGNGATKWPGSELIQTFSEWGSAALIDVSGAFNGATSLTTIPTANPPSSIMDMSYMFSDASGLYDVSGDLLNAINWNVDYVTASAFFVSPDGVNDTTLTDVNSPFFPVPPTMTLSFVPGTLVYLPISGIDGSLIVNWHDDRGNVTYTNGTDISGTTTGQVDVFGSFTSFGLGSASWTGAFNLLDVSGSPSGLTDLSGAFNYAYQFSGSYLHNWDVSGVTDMSYMFYSASAFNNNLANWVTHNVKDMSHMFEVADAFVGTGIGAWDVSKVTDMNRMFGSAANFNTDLGGWERSTPTQSTVANVRNMSYMFINATDFSGNSIQAWDVSGVTDMKRMFDNARAFNVDLGSWDTRNVKDMSFMFNSARLYDGSGVEHWDVSGVTDMTRMFANTSFNNVRLGSWDTSSVRNMKGMFESNTIFMDSSAGVNLWDVSEVTDMSSMFADTSFNNVSLGSWDTSSVRNMARMFEEATLFTGDSIQNWNVSNVSDMNSMFRNTVVFNNSQLSNWERDGSTLAAVRDMDKMFFLASGMYDEYGFKYPLNNWNVSNVSSKTHMIYFNEDTTTMDPNSPFYVPVIIPSLSLTFSAGTEVTLPISGIDSSGVQVKWYDISSYITYYEGSDISGVAVSGQVYIAGNFTGFGYGTRKWTGVENLINISFNSTTITDLSGAFNSSEGSFTSPTSIPTSVTNLSWLFANATSSPEVGSWVVSNVTNMAGMFFQATNYASQYTDDLSNWNVRQVKDMNRMFAGTFSDLSGLEDWEPIACTNMNGMFFNTSEPILDLSGWKTYLNPLVTYTQFYTNAADISGSRLSPFYVAPVPPVIPVIPSRSPMILTVDVSGSRAFSLPITGISGDLVVDWGDGGVTLYTSGPVTHTDVSGAPHQIRVYGDFTGFGSFGWAGLHNLTSVNSWGDNVLLRSLDFAFKGATRLVSVPTIPATVRSLNSTFANSTFNGDISGWLMTNVTDVTSMLADASGFTRNLTNWAYSLGPNVLNTNFFTTGTYDCSALTDPVTQAIRSPFYANIPAPSNSLFKSIASFSTQPNPFYQMGDLIYGAKDITLFSIDTSGNYTPLQTLSGPTIGSVVGHPASGQTIFGIVDPTPFGGQTPPAALFSYDTSYNIVGTFSGTPNPSMTFDVTGNLYATDSTGAIYKVTPTTPKSIQRLPTIIETDLNIVGPLAVNNNILSGSDSSGAIISVDMGNLTVTVTQPIPNAQPSSCIVNSGKVYFYDMSGTSLNMYTIANQTSTLLWDFSGNPLKGTRPIDQISIDMPVNIIDQKLYGICQEGGPGLGNGARGGGTVWSYKLPSGPMTVLNSYVLGDTTRGSTPVSYSITDMVDAGTANVVTQGGGFRPRFNVRVVSYQLTQVTLPGFTSCFNQGSKILRQLHGVDTWSPIETLRCGDLIKTYKHGYRAITNIGRGLMINNPDLWHSCMYQGQKEGHEPLIVTGGHGFLVDNLTLDEQEAQAVFWGRGEEVIDDKLLMIAPVSKDFKPILTTDLFTYYHFTVENDGDDDRRYGVYANGFLTETPSVNQYKQHKYHSL